MVYIKNTEKINFYYYYSYVKNKLFYLNNFIFRFKFFVSIYTNFYVQFYSFYKIL